MTGSLRKIFGSDVASSAFHVIDGETRIVGKFAQITLTENGLLDIWLVGLGLKPLSTRKLTHIMKMFPQEAKFLVLTGEAYTQIRGKQLILKTLSLLGIKKKRNLSLAAREKLIKRLERTRPITESGGHQNFPKTDRSNRGVS